MARRILDRDRDRLPCCILRTVGDRPNPRPLPEYAIPAGLPDRGQRAPGSLIGTGSHSAAVCIAADPSGIAGEFTIATTARVQAIHWLLHALALKTTLTGWLLASFRGWPMSLLDLPAPLTPASDNAEAARAIDGHQAMEWTLLVVIVLDTHIVVTGPGLAIAKSTTNASRSRVASKSKRPSGLTVAVAFARYRWLRRKRESDKHAPPIIDVGQSPQPKGFWGSEAACNCPGVRSTR